MTFAAPFLAATALLVLAGTAKLWRPHDTARALGVAGLPAGARAVRAGSAVEMAVAAAALIWPSAVTGSLVAGSYAVFAGFVAVALWRGWPLSTCGCFGRPDSRPGYGHLALDIGAAAAAAWWAEGAPASLGRLFVHQPWHGGPLILESLVIAGLAYLVWENPARRVAP